MPSLTGTRPRLSESTLRFSWRKYKCAPEKMVWISILNRLMKAPPETKEAWEVFDSLLKEETYPGDNAWTYVCRFIANTTRPSTHSFGIACDLDPDKNPYLVNATWTNTILTKLLVSRLLAIRTNNKKPVFAWGGQWNSRQDLMHWYIVCRPSDLLTGIDYTTVMTITPDELEFLRQMKTAVERQNSDPFGALFYSIQLVRDHRPGGPLAPKDAVVDLSQYELVKKSTV